MIRSNKYRFTIFTPCYNSQRFIDRVFESIQSQDFYDFEWLVIDDASSDDTYSILKAYQAQSSFPMRIIRNESNKMLYYNFNLAFDLAEGELMVFAGHDDKFHPQTLRLFDETWTKFGNENISGIWCLCQDQNGKLVGTNFPAEITISNYFEMFERFIYSQERFGCTRTDILKKNKFDLTGSNVGESFLWEAIGLKYKTIYFNKILRTYYVEPNNGEALTKRSRNQLSKVTFSSYRNWVNHYLFKSKFSFLLKLRFHFAFVFYGILSGETVAEIVKKAERKKSKMLAIAFFPFAYLLSIILEIKRKH